MLEPRRPQSPLLASPFIKYQSVSASLMDNAR